MEKKSLGVGTFEAIGSGVVISYPAIVVGLAILLHAGVIYFFGWKLGRIIGVKNKNWPFIWLGIGFTSMYIPRFVTMAHVEGWLFDSMATVNNVNSTIYLIDSIIFLVAGWGVCKVFKEALDHMEARR